MRTLALGDAADPELAQWDPEAIDAELQRLGRLVDGLLAVARSESDIAIDVVDVVEVVGSVLTRWTPLANEHDVTLATSMPGSPVRARVVSDGLEQILDNLLDNALGMGPPGISIEVSVATEPGCVVLRVRDHGPGLSAPDRSSAMDRFWRAPDGSGLVVQVRLPLNR